MSNQYCDCGRPEGFRGSLEWRTPVHAGCGRLNRQIRPGLQGTFEYHDEGEIGAVVVEEILRRNEQGQAVRIDPAGLREEVERETASNRLNLPLPDGVWLRFYREHPNEVLSPEHGHLRADVQAARRE